MKVKVHELRRRIDQTRDRLYTRAVNQRIEEQQRWDARLEDWKQKRADVLHEIAVHIGGKAARDEPVTEADMRRGGFDLMASPSYSSALVWRTSETVRPKNFTFTDWVQPEWLIELDQFVSLLDEDEVSSYALEKAGVIGHLRRLKSSR